VTLDSDTSTRRKLETYRIPNKHASDKTRVTLNPRLSESDSEVCIRYGSTYVCNRGIYLQTIQHMQHTVVEYSTYNVVLTPYS